MGLIQKIILGLEVVYCRILKINKPLFVSWSLTNRCNLHCKYCEIPSVESKELSIEQIFEIIDRLKIAGTRVIAFTGGEPLLRKDIGKIVDYAKEKGMYLKLNSNGILVKKRINELKNLDILQLSFDGPKEVHDKQRGKGSYDAVMDAVKAARQKGIRVYFNSTITNLNVKYLGYISDKVKEMKIPTSFQPVTDIFFGAKEIKRLYPKKEDFRIAMKELYDMKSSNPYILNSYTSLTYMLGWPHGRKIDCFAGRINYRIASDGAILSCNRTMQKFSKYNCLNENFEKVFDRKLNVDCPGCWCITALELNYSFSFKLEPILNIIKLQFLK